MEKVTIIMPVYNAEKYVSKAIESVLKQTYTNFELLLIDDKSTDNSKKICDEFSQKDSRIIVYENNSDNHGPGATRNIGLDHAAGEYIYFMDSDDWIDDRLLEASVNRILETKADIVQFGVKYEQNNGMYSREYCQKQSRVFTKKDIKQDFFTFWNEKNCYLWIHFFRYETVKNIKFEYIINGEDVSYVMDALSRAKTIAFIPETFYHYRYVEGSTCHRWVPNIMECLEVQWKHTKSFLDSFNGELNPLAYAEAAYFDYIWAMYQLCLNICPLPYREKQRKLLELKDQMEFESYRGIYPLKMQHGLMKVKCAFVKYHFEWLILLIGPLFLHVVRGE